MESTILFKECEKLGARNQKIIRIFLLRNHQASIETPTQSLGSVSYLASSLSLGSARSRPTHPAFAKERRSQHQKGMPRSQTWADRAPSMPGTRRP